MVEAAMATTARKFRKVIERGAPAAALLLVVAACGDDSSDAGGDTAGGGSGDPIQLGYSAWPGWFPLAVAEEAGIFDEVGVDVELVFFSDYLGAIDAMAAGQLDGNGQTLNDTLVSVSAGSDQRVVIVTDNSAGNDAIIVDESIRSIEDLEGATVAAELGIVDHFLLLQGLETVGLTEDDVDFRGVPTEAAAASFAGGEFDAVGVFAPFTLQALEREGAHILFDSTDFPGTIPDLFVFTPEVVEERPDDVQLVVDAWYEALAWMDENPDEALEILAAAAEVSPEEYASLQDGTLIFDAAQAREAFEGDELPAGLLPMSEQINDFLVDSGLAESPAPLDDLLEPSFTLDYLERAGGAGG
jgi:NitT/TauT family transport system substrate-binding protein